MEIPKKIKGIMQKLIDNKFEAYIIGGAVRDHFFGIEPHDYDIFTNATGKQILKVFPNGRVMGGEERQAKILTVIVDGVEVSQYRSNGDRTEVGNTLEQHQATCDFTINAMAVDINGNFTNSQYNMQGRSDIDSKILRFVGNADERIKEDKLRVMRAIRFICKYNLKVGRQTLKQIMKTYISNLPKERIREELLEIMKYKNGIFTLARFNLLSQIIPELFHENHFMSGGDHHDETPIDHMINAFQVSCDITDNVLLKFAIMLHDIGKGESRSETAHTGTDMNGNEIESDWPLDVHFYNHETIGIELTKKIMKRLKFSKNEIKFVTHLIKTHMFGYKSDIKDKTYVKFFGTLEEHGVDIMDYVMLIYCDRQANMAKKRMKFGDFVKSSGMNFLLHNYYRVKYDIHKPFSIRDLAINGNDIMKFGVKGQEIGEILKDLYDCVMDGELQNIRPDLMFGLKAIINSRYGAVGK